MRQFHAALLILLASSYSIAAEPAAMAPKVEKPAGETQPASRPATAPASMAATQPNDEHAALPQNAERQLTVNSRLKPDAPVTIKNYWDECLEYKPQVTKDVQTLVEATRRNLDRTMNARIGVRPAHLPYSPDVMYYGTYASKQAAIQSAREALARQQETLKKISSDAVPFKPLKDPMLQQDKDSPLGSIGTINYLLINKIVSPTEAIVALNWMPVQAQAAVNPAYRPGMPPPYAMGGVTSPTAYLRYPPSPYVYQGGFNYLITEFNTEATVEGSKIQRPLVVQVTGTRKIKVEGEERSVFVLRVLRLEDFFEPE